MLALLERAPAHGYELKRGHDALFQQGRPLRFGQIYATLARLVRDGQAELLGEEPGQGPDRKRYAITPPGREALEHWLLEPEPPEPHLQTTLFTKIALASISGRPAAQLLEAQREVHLERMRELTRLRRDAGLAETLLCDHALFHLEADLRWMEQVGARLDELATEVAK